jgi:hypothetical protein
MVTSRSKESYFTKSYFLTAKFAIYLQKSGLSHEKQLFNHEIHFFVIELNFFVIKTSTHSLKRHEMEHIHGRN